MNVSDFLQKLENHPEQIEFSESMQVIQDYYSYTASMFKNGEIENAAGENEGSCKIFAFAQIHKLDKASTLACFGDYYRVDVLQHPENSDHQNIRQFMQHGWEGIQFQQQALVER